MRNKRRLSEVILGIVLIAVILPANSQITKLFPVTEKVSPKTSVLPIQDTFSNEPYSEKIFYPPPPGVRLSKTSSTESTLSTLGVLVDTSTSKSLGPKGKEAVPNQSNRSKSPVSDVEEKLPNESNQSIELSSSTEGISDQKVILSNKINLPNEQSSASVQEAIQFKQGPIQIDLALTTEAFFVTEATQAISDPKKTTLSTESAFTKETNASGTETVPIETTTSKVFETISNPKPCLTPIGKSGECKDIHQCPSLLNLLMREPLLVENKLYLQRSQCGFEKHTVLTCCPDNVPAPIISPKWSLLPKPRVCGSMVENRLYGGYYTEIDSYSWMALLEYAKGGNETGFHCGGSLISDRYVLTAAHCVTGLPKTWSIKSVRLGEWDVDTNMDCSKFNDFVDCSDPHINVSIEEVIPHKGYLPTSKNQLHDIALIRLSQKVNYTDFIKPICLPHDENNLHAFDEQGLDLVGWGASPEGLSNNIKEKATVHVMQLNKCRSKYEENNIILEQSQFCVEGRIKNDTCRIDSGGPIISFDTSNKGLGSYYIAGIQSFGPLPCWVDGLPGVYTRVGEYLDWILENIHA